MGVTETCCHSHTMLSDIYRDPRFIYTSFELLPESHAPLITQKRVVAQFREHKRGKFTI